MENHSLIWYRPTPCALVLLMWPFESIKPQPPLSPFNHWNKSRPVVDVKCHTDFSSGCFWRPSGIPNKVVARSITWLTEVILVVLPGTTWEKWQMKTPYFRIWTGMYIIIRMHCVLRIHKMKLLQQWKTTETLHRNGNVFQNFHRSSLSFSFLNVLSLYVKFLCKDRL